MKTYALLIISFFLFACGEEKREYGHRFEKLGPSVSSPTEEKTKQSSGSNERLQISDLEFLVVDGDIHKARGGLAGSGTLMAVQPIGSITSDQHFKISVELEEGGSAEFFSFVTKDQASGIRLQILEESFRLSGPRDSFESNTVADAKKSYSMDIHNSEDPTHVILWEGLRAGRDLTPILDTAEDGIRLGIADGNYFGIKLNKAKIISIEISQPKMSH